MSKIRYDSNYDQMPEEADRGTRQYVCNIEFQLRLLITFSVPFTKCFVRESFSVEPWITIYPNVESKYIKILEIYHFG